MTSKPSILLLGNYRPTHVLAKMLAKRGYNVIAGSHEFEVGFKYSRYVSSIWDHPNGAQDPDLFFEKLVEFCADTPKLAGIFPVVEDYVRLFAEHPQWAGKLPPLIMNDSALVLKCVDKLHTMRVSKHLDIPIAPFGEALNEKQLQQFIAKVGFPIVIRPAVATTSLSGKKAAVVHSLSDIEELKIEWEKHPKGLVLQQKFTGLRHNIYFAAYHGEMFRYLHAIIQRTNSLNGTGLAVDGITMEADTNLRQQTKRLIKRLNYTGVGCVQYLVNEFTAETSFLEINPRIAGNHAVPEYAELQLGDYLVDLTLNDKQDLTPFIGRGGIRYAWTSADIIAAKTAWSKGEISLLKAIRWFFKIIETGLRAKVHMFFTWTDPKPGLVALIHALPFLSRTSFGKKLLQYLGDQSGVSGETPVKRPTITLPEKNQTESNPHPKPSSTPASIIPRQG